MSDDAPSAGYLELIRTNRDFRNLWLGDVISLLGDWFNTIAIYTLLQRLTGSPFALGLVFIIKMAAFALASPLAGVIADRYDRRRLMIGSDLARAVTVAGFLLIDSVDDVPLLYTLVATQIALGSVFRPARSASIPNITAPRELLTANALMATTWSSLLALGAALGGVVTGLLGTRVVFTLDALTYLVSAACIARVHLPARPHDPARKPLWRAAFGELLEGWRYLRRAPGIARLSLAKAMWATGGSGLVYMLALLGAELTPAEASFGIGALFAARGIGTGVGPIAARAIFRDPTRWTRVMGVCVITSGLFYATLGGMDWTWLVLLPIATAHALSGANWVLSTVLLQERAEDALRGRVFSIEWQALTLTNVASVLLASTLLEARILTLSQAFLTFSALMITAGITWLFTLRRS